MKISFSLAVTVLGLVGGADARFRVRSSKSAKTCERDPGTGVSTGCAEGEYCELAVGDCMLMSATHTGTCSTPPQMCTADYRPVCGCDGVTYANACSAQGASMSIQFEGACESQVGDACTTPPDSCTGGLFCELPTGDCNLMIAVHSGSCQAPPEMCTLDINPVCGCDGNTYDNACLALSNSVSIALEGNCPGDGKVLIE